MWKYLGTGKRSRNGITEVNGTLKETGHLVIVWSGSVSESFRVGPTMKEKEVVFLDVPRWDDLLFYTSSRKNS